MAGSDFGIEATVRITATKQCQCGVGAACVIFRAFMGGQPNGSTPTQVGETLLFGQGFNFHSQRTQGFRALACELTRAQMQKVCLG